MISDPRIDAALQHAVAAGEVGIQVAAYLGTDLIVDTHAGARNGEGAPVEPTTLFPVFSSSKAMISMLTLVRAERGYFSIDEPIATYWPEYGCRGKETISVRHVLAHRAGVPQMPPHVATDDDLADWPGIIRALEQIEPLSAPMERSHYHGVSIYYLLGEVLRRTDPEGRLFDELFADEICAPVGIDDLWFRLPPSEDHRVAELTYGDAAPASWSLGGMADMYAMMCPPAHRPTPENHNRPAIRRLLQGNLYATARAGARFWSLLANGGELDGVRLLSKETVAALAVPAGDPAQVDEITGNRPCYSLGLQVGGLSPHLSPVVGSGRRTVCHTGGGGTLAWADLDTGLSVMYTHNRMRSNEPFDALGDAVRAVAAEHRST